MSSSTRYTSPHDLCTGKSLSESSIHENFKLKPGENMLCTEIVSDIQNRTIFVHNMFSPCSAKRRASDKDLPVINQSRLLYSTEILMVSNLILGYTILQFFQTPQLCSIKATLFQFQGIYIRCHGSQR